MRPGAKNVKAKALTPAKKRASDSRRRTADFRGAVETRPAALLYPRPTEDDCDPRLWRHLGAAPLPEAVAYARTRVTSRMDGIASSSRQAQAEELERLYDLETVILALPESRQIAVLQALGCEAKLKKVGLSLLKGLCCEARTLERLEEVDRKTVLSRLSLMSRAFAGARLNGVGPKGYAAFLERVGGIEAAAGIARAATRHRREAAKAIKSLEEGQPLDGGSQNPSSADAAPTQTAPFGSSELVQAGEYVRVAPSEQAKLAKAGQPKLCVLRWAGDIPELVAVRRRPKGFRDDDAELLQACLRVFANSDRATAAVRLAAKDAQRRRGSSK